VPKTHLNVIEGMVPGLLDLPSGCRFENRCPRRQTACTIAPPPIEQISDSHQVSCLRWKEL
jgi:peptide/nickel transport system ATP-binding protein